MKEENERLRAERAAKLASTSSQSLNPDGSSKLVFKVKRARDGEGEDVATGGAANAAQGATNAAKPNEDLTTGPTLGDQR